MPPTPHEALQELEALVEVMGWKWAGLEEEADLLAEGLAAHCDAKGMPIWQVNLVLCFTLAQLICEPYQADWEKVGSIYIGFLQRCLQALAPLLVTNDTAE